MKSVISWKGRKWNTLNIFLYIICVIQDCAPVLTRTTRPWDVGLFLMSKTGRLNDSEKILRETQMRVGRWGPHGKRKHKFHEPSSPRERRMAHVNVALSHVHIQELSLNGQIDTQVGNLIVWFYFARHVWALPTSILYQPNVAMREIPLDRKYYRRR